MSPCWGTLFREEGLSKRGSDESTGEPSVWLVRIGAKPQDSDPVSLAALKLRGREHQAMTPVWLSTPAPKDPAGIVYVAKRAHESADQAVWRYLQQNPKDRCAALAYVFEAGDGD